MSVLFAKLLDSALDVADAAQRGLARRSLEQQKGTGKKLKSREPSCSICALPARQEKAQHFVHDVQVLAGTRNPSVRHRARPVVRKGAAE